MRRPTLRLPTEESLVFSLKKQLSSGKAVPNSNGTSLYPPLSICRSRHADICRLATIHFKKFFRKRGRGGLGAGWGACLATIIAGALKWRPEIRLRGPGAPRCATSRAATAQADHRGLRRG